MWAVFIVGLYRPIGPAGPPWLAVDQNFEVKKNIFSEPIRGKNHFFGRFSTQSIVLNRFFPEKSTEKNSGKSIFGGQNSAGPQQKLPENTRKNTNSEHPPLWPNFPKVGGGAIDFLKLPVFFWLPE